MTASDQPHSRPSLHARFTGWGSLTLSATRDGYAVTVDTNRRTRTYHHPSYSEAMSDFLRFTTEAVDNRMNQ